MSAPESAVVAPVNAVEEVVNPETTPAVVDPEVKVPAAVAEDAVTGEAVEATATEDPAKSETKAEDENKKEVPPKSPNFLSKLLSGFKGEKKAKVPKSPKKEKKKEEVEATATEEAPKETSATEAPVEAVETVKEAEPAVTETAEVPVVAVAEEVKKEVREPPRGLKVGRRLSARVGDFFKPKPKTEVTTPAKVDEYPPKIDQPEPVAPLENPASEEAKVEAAKPVEASAPVVAATA
jgi:hypothetical protein